MSLLSTCQQQYIGLTERRLMDRVKEHLPRWLFNSGEGNSTSSITEHLLNEGHDYNPNVGKTSLIISLVSEEFSPTVPPRSDEITIPADVTPERVPTQIIDYSSRSQTEEELHAEVRTSDVVCLVYALDDAKTLEKVRSYWLPLIRSAGSKTDQPIPVVLVGNKLDLVVDGMSEAANSIMTDFSEVETCIECSALRIFNLSEMFWFAQKAVLYPTAPLYCIETKQLTPDCTRALTRVFRICDIDNDGCLSDIEMEAFQSRCFSIPSTPRILHDVKQLLRQHCPDGVSLSGVTQRGFLCLHLIFIQKGRSETAWTVLRQFGYDNQLHLSSDFLRPHFEVPKDCSTELSSLGIQFLLTLFNKFDKDRDGCLSTSELTELMTTCPDAQLTDALRIADCVTTNQAGWVTRRGFIAYWMLTAFCDPALLIESFAHLGFAYFAAGSSSTASHRLSDRLTPLANFANQSNGSFASSTTNQRSQSNQPIGAKVAARRDSLLRALVVSANRRFDAVNQSTHRSVFYCRVYGARKVGKTCLLQGLLGRSLAHSDGGLSIGGSSARVSSNWTAACNLPVCGQPRALLMHEISALAGDKMQPFDALKADVACLVYDVTNAESFAYAAQLFYKYYRSTRVPCLFVAAKSDQPAVVQSYPMDPADLIAKYHLTSSVAFSSLDVNHRTHSLGSFAAPASQDDARVNNSTTTSIDRGDEGDSTSFNLESFMSTKPTVTDTAQSTGVDRTRRHSRSDAFTSGKAGLFDWSAGDSKDEVDDQFHEVYITLTTLGNYPHLSGMQLSSNDYAWKWTLAATILAGFGFVAFRIAKTHL